MSPDKLAPTGLPTSAADVDTPGANAGTGTAIAQIAQHGAVKAARSLALCAAIAASMFGPTVLAGRGGLRTDLLVAVMVLLPLGALMQAQLGRLRPPRSLRAWLGWIAGSLALVPLSTMTLGLGMVGLLFEQGAPIAVMAMGVWLVALGLNAVEARRAYGLARACWTVRNVLFRLGMVWLLLLSALRLGDLALPLLRQLWWQSALEGLAGAAAAGIGGLLVLPLAVLAWRVSPWLAQRQLDGRVAASTASESLWFAALGAWSLPVAMTSGVIVDPSLGLSAGGWAEHGLHTLTIVMAHGLVRVALGRAGSAPPVPLLVLVANPLPTARTRRLLARLPGAWSAGPVCRVMPPTAAAREHGVHLQLAGLAGEEALLFPNSAAELAAWLRALPPWGQWRALSTPELYLPPHRWAEVLVAWQTPQTWVLLVEDGAPGGHGTVRGTDTPWAADLPDGRTLRVDAGGADEADWPAALRRHPCWQAAPSAASTLIAQARQGQADVSGLTSRLRQQLAPVPPRRLLLLHDRVDAALAQALVRALDGHTDAAGRFVDAWTLNLGGSIDWGMPLAGIRLTAQVQVQHLQRRLAARPAPTFRERVLLQAQLGSMRIWAAPGAADEAPDYDLILLHSPALVRSAAQWALPAEQQSMVIGARRRLAIQLGASGTPVCRLDAQMVTPVADTASLDAAARQALAERLAQQVLADAWVALAADPIEPLAAPVSMPMAAQPAPADKEDMAALLGAIVGSGDVSAVAGSDDGELWLGHRDGRITRQSATGQARAALEGHRATVTALCPLVQRRAVSAAADGAVMLWDGDRSGGREIGRHPAAVRALATLGQAVVAGDEQGLLQVWPLDDADAPGHRWQLGQGIVAIGIEAAAEHLQVLGAGGDLWRIALREQAEPEPSGINTGAVCCLGCSGGALYLGGQDPQGKGFLHRRRLASGGLADRDLTGLPSGAVRHLLVLHDERVVFATDSGEVFIWAPSVGANQLDTLPRPPARVRALTAIGATALLVLDDEGSVSRWPLPDGR